MPTTYPGDPLIYYRFSGAPVIDAAGSGLLPSLPGGQVKVNGTVVSVRELEGALVTSVQTSAAGLFPDVMVPLANPDTDVVTLDYADDGIDPQPMYMEAREARAYDRTANVAAATAAVQDAVNETVAAITPQSLGMPFVVGRPGVPDPTESDLVAGESLIDVFALDAGDPV